MISSLEKQVLFCLHYSNFFHFPLSVDEVWLRLPYFYKKKLNFSKNKYKIKDINRSAQQLIKKKAVLKQGKYFTIKSGQKNFGLRNQNLKYSVGKNYEVEQFVNFAKKISFIRAVGITGALAVNNAVENDDVDFMIVTEANRLWLSRLLIIIYAIFKGKKGFPWQKKLDWCFNLWLTESNLAISKTQQDLYTAYESCQIKWALDKWGIKKKFFEKNSWIKNYLPNYYKQIKKDFINQKQNKFRSKKKMVCQFCLNFIDRFLFIVESLYLQLKLKMDHKKFSRNAAFLHQGGVKKKLFRYLTTVIQNEL